MTIYEQLKKLAGDEAQVIRRGNNPDNPHFQIRGVVLVNYYPLSKGRSAYIAGMTGAIKNVTPEEAVQYAVRPTTVKRQRTRYLRRDKRRSGKNKTFKDREFAKAAKEGKEAVPCYWCGTPLSHQDATVDHLIPLHAKGLDHHLNKVIACQPCNAERGHRMPEKPADEKMT